MIQYDVCIIRAKLKRDYVYDAIKHYGYHIHTPYKGDNIFLRIIREMWFRNRLPYKEIWFKKSKDKVEYKNIIFFDPLIVPEYIEWIHEKYPHSKIILSYENRANKTINPDAVPSYVIKWSYDMEDCNEYSMHWMTPSFLGEYKRECSPIPKYDVLYVGRDKGRAEYLLQLEKELKEIGLKTYFHICADRQYLKLKKKYYKKLLSYDEYLELLVDSRAILNIVPEGQRSVTQREMEAVFDGIKCITNNLGVKDFELYDKSVFFILGEDNIKCLPLFLNVAPKAYDTELLKQYDFKNRIEKMLDEGEA